MNNVCNGRKNIYSALEVGLLKDVFFSSNVIENNELGGIWEDVLVARVKVLFRNSNGETSESRN